MKTPNVLIRTITYHLATFFYLVLGSMISTAVASANIPAIVVLMLILLLVGAWVDYRVELKARDIYYGTKKGRTN